MAEQPATMNQQRKGANTLPRVTRKVRANLSQRMRTCSKPPPSQIHRGATSTTVATPRTEACLQKRAHHRCVKRKGSRRILHSLTRPSRKVQSQSAQDIVLHSPAELARFDKYLTEGPIGRRAAIRSFKCAWPEDRLLSAAEVLHLICILYKLTDVIRLELPLGCKACSVVDYDVDPSTGKVPTLLPPSIFTPLLREMRTMSNLRVLDVKLDILLQFPDETLESMISWRFGRNLRSLRIIRSCLGHCAQESPARICAALDAPALTYLEIRDIDFTQGTCNVGNVDVLTGTVEADEAEDKVQQLVTIVWEPCWSSRQLKSDPLYRETVRDYLWDLLGVFSEGLFLLCEDATNALLLGCDHQRSVPFTRIEVGEEWWTMDSWGESWIECLQAVGNGA